MRWQNLRTDSDRAAPRLPGLDAGEATRTFDAPAAMGVQFHEVEARSALNEVPPLSYVDFRYTINPYRGCTHACRFCLCPESLVMRGSGNTARIEDLRVGDEIYGTRREGRYRRYGKTEVLAHWRTEKPAYRVALENGTELIASGDHRFLTDRGWRFVTGAGQAYDQRPHLTTSDRLLGLGVALPLASHNEAYRRGYICGILQGDGCVGAWPGGKGRSRRVHSMRLALADPEGLERTQGFLAAAGVPMSRRVLQQATERHREVGAIGVGGRDAVRRCRELMQFAPRPSMDWWRGFLAGIFDAEGGCSHAGAPRISSTDDRIVARVEDGLGLLGLGSRLEHRPTESGRRLWSVRLLGGPAARTRFFQACDPAIARKRSMTGLAVKAKDPLGVVAIEPLGETIEMYDITTGTGDFIADGVISHNCFARPTHTYLGLNAREDFDRQIIVKVNLPEVLRAELKRPSWKGEHVALGTNTDPYQWVEGRYRLTRGVWEELLAARNPCSVLTKSPLLLRDLDLFRELDERTEFAANLSIPTLDEKAWRASEPGTPHPRKRIEALAELSAAGIRTGVLVAPLMPGINDSPAQVNEILELCGEAGASTISGIGLHLRGEVRGIFLDWLRQYRPDLLTRYERLYERRAYLPAAERKRLGRLLRHGRMAGGAAPRAHGREQSGPGRAGPSTADSPADGPRDAHARPGIAQRLF